MSTDYTRPPWLDDPVVVLPAPAVGPPPLPAPPVEPAAPTATGQESAVLGELSAAEYRVVEELRGRVSTRLAAEDRSYDPEVRRELSRQLIRDEYAQWLLHEANHGRAAPAELTEDAIFAAVLADLEGGLGRLGPLLARPDVEDVHFEGNEPTVLRLASGELVTGPPVADSDEELAQLLRAIGARADDGQSSREFSSSAPTLNVRMKGVTALGARLQAAMDVLPRPAGVIRVHRFSDVTLRDLTALAMIDAPMQAFLHYVVLAGASLLVTGAPGVGKTTMLRALGATIPFNNVVVSVEDERELGLHLPRWDAETQRQVHRHAVRRSFESRLPNAEGRGGYGMGQALHEALRMSPTWVLVGEVRGAYVMHLLEAATSGLSSVMCTIHSPTADGIFDKVLTAALRASPAPTPELVLRSLSALDVVVHVQRDAAYRRFVSGIYELGRVGDSGLPDLRPVFAPRRGDRRGVATGAGSLSEGLGERVEGVGFDLDWLHPARSGWDAGPAAAEVW